VTLLLPVLLYRHRVPPGWWAHPLAAPGAVLAVLLPLYMIDCLMNAMLNPVFVLAIGGLAGAGVKARATRLARSSPRASSPVFVAVNGRAQHAA
jgi:hypothetical protein